MRLRYLNLLIILVLACGKNSYIPTNKLSIPIVSKSKNEIKFDYIETVILKPSMGEFIGYPSGFHANNNQFLIADRTRNKMLVFDSSGKMLYVAGGAGSGPGEFKKLTYSSFGKNFIVGFDGAKYGVNVYDNTGEFLYMINRGMHGIIIQNSYLCIGVGDVLHCNTLPENWAKKSIFLTVANNHNIPLASSFSLKKMCYVKDSIISGHWLVSKKIIPQQELVLEQGSEGYSCYCYQHIPILYNSKKAFSINTNRFRWKAGKIKRMIKTKKLGVNFKLSVGANDSLVAVFYFANNGNKEERLLHMSMYTTVGVPLLVDYAMKEDQKGLKKTTSVFFNGELDHRKNVFYALCADNIGEDLDERYIIQKYGLIY